MNWRIFVNKKSSIILVKNKSKMHWIKQCKEFWNYMNGKTLHYLRNWYLRKSQQVALIQKIVCIFVSDSLQGGKESMKMKLMIQDWKFKQITLMKFKMKFRKHYHPKANKKQLFIIYLMTLQLMFIMKL